LKQEKLKAETYRNDITKLTNSKVELKNQLTLYSEKFDHFQDALTRSQKMFVQFEEKMVTMEQTVEKLEAMNQKLKAECHGYDVELLSQLDRKDKGMKQFEILQKQKKRMSNECRIVQAQRNEVTTKLEQLLARGETVVKEEQQGEEKENGDVGETAVN
jgi:chromosome segregation ATPase